MERWTRPEDERLLTGKGRYVANIHDGHLGSTGSPALDLAVLTDARRMLDRDGTRHTGVGLVRTHVGANAHAGAVSRIGALLGYHVTVCDARATFTTPERFPDADEVVVDWPHRYLAYVGALGSRRVQARRRKDLTTADVSPDAVARLHAPLGLDLGASTPGETAVSFVAELVAVRSGRTARPLSVLDGPSHPAAHGDRPGAADARCAAGTDPVRGRTTAAPRAH
ncbi:MULTISPECIES: XdhC family protein [unclassified Streptomyces]|uniref:XdhC family protein n=1 Tax=unclassified Streptomyces TaxID=2593676 RepID=UPI00068C7960|nr:MULTISPECIES: XdhC family protein [unclassified Streptomyces]